MLRAVRKQAAGSSVAFTIRGSGAISKRTMLSSLQTLDQQAGLVTALGKWLRRPIAGGPAWRFVWPATIAFTFLVQVITGLVIWMYYSPGAQSSWESVYYLQYHVQAAGCSGQSTFTQDRQCSCCWACIWRR